MDWCLCSGRYLMASVWLMLHKKEREKNETKTEYRWLSLRKVLCGICLSGATLCLTVRQLLLDNHNQDQDQDQDWSAQKIMQHLIKIGLLRLMCSAIKIFDQFWRDSILKTTWHLVSTCHPITNVLVKSQIFSWLPNKQILQGAGPEEIIFTGCADVLYLFLRQCLL